MSLFGRLVERRAISFQEVWGRGGSPAGAMSEQRALRLAAVYAAVRTIGDGIGVLPIHEYRETESGRLERTLPSPLVASPSLSARPIEWKFQAVASLALRGNAYGLPVARDWYGRVTKCEWLHPDSVQLNGEDDVLWWQGRPLEWLVEGRPTRDLIHVRNFALPGRMLGLSPIGAFRVLIETGLEAQQYGHDWFENGSVPAAVLETDQAVRQSDAQAIKDRFVAAAKGRAPVTLGRGVKYKPISVAPNEAQFLDTIKATAGTIASIFGIPAEEIGGETGGSLTYNSDETRARRIHRTTLRPYATRLEETLSALLPRGRSVKFNLDANLRADTLTRYQAHSLALRDGWKNRDEVREHEDMGPLPNGEGQEYVVAPVAQTFGPQSGGSTA